MEKIKCTIERITFQNPENGYSVLQTTIKGYREEQTVVGIFHEVTVGAVLTVEGNWRVDKRYGRQFAAEKWTEELPADIIGIEKYLGSGLVKGIGPKFAKQIVSHFGLETFEVIEFPAGTRCQFHLCSQDLQAVRQGQYREGTEQSLLFGRRHLGHWFQDCRRHSGEVGL